jgi:hypothetical protein
MEATDRRILFVIGEDEVLLDAPLDTYVPGDIKETKERLAAELGIKPDEIHVRIKGLQSGNHNKGPSLGIQLLDSKTIKDYMK